ncbi:SDR family oxidoreductase [Streptomyces sp. NPDC048636]|uniref:SDR family oxidoreductase n=1 Tax=Streptomyces sp. NPDC048636 TaxID=3155762 RepID=UPI003425E2EA
MVTGAGSGIGAAIARRLHARRDDLWLPARNAERAAELAETFPGARVVVADLAQPAELATAVERAGLPSRLDSLVHAAGCLTIGRVDEVPASVWEATLAVNLIAPAELTRLLLPALRSARGHVVFVNSSAGLSTRVDFSVYSASKYGLKALADTLRAEEHGHGVRVTSVHPGRTATPMGEQVLRYEGRGYEPTRLISPESVATAILTAIDLPRDAELADVTLRSAQQS